MVCGAVIEARTKGNNAITCPDGIEALGVAECPEHADVGRMPVEQIFGLESRGKGSADSVAELGNRCARISCPGTGQYEWAVCRGDNADRLIHRSRVGLRHLGTQPTGLN